MSLKLYYHPLSSFCWKVLIALYEADIAFEPVLVDLSDTDERAMLAALWPFARFPVLVEGDAAEVWPESTVIIERLAQTHAGARSLLPADPALALPVRLRDRFFDLYLHDPMQRIVSDRIRPADSKDPLGVETQRALIATAYGMVEAQMRDGSWAMGEAFTLADCAAAPALFYANKVAPMGEENPHTQAYLARLMRRPSFARVLAEAEPYFAMFPA